MTMIARRISENFLVGLCGQGGRNLETSQRPRLKGYRLPVE